MQVLVHGSVAINTAKQPSSAAPSSAAPSSALYAKTVPLLLTVLGSHLTDADSTITHCISSPFLCKNGTVHAADKSSVLSLSLP